MISPISSINKTIIMEPIAANNNQYIQIVSGLLQKRHDVVSIEQAFRHWPKFKRANTVAILNWFESKISHSRFPLLGFIKSVAILLYLKVACSKIVWVKHNHQPHDNKGALSHKLTNGIEWLLSHLSDEVLTHDDVDGLQSTVVPHPLYLRERYQEQGIPRDIEFLIFGQIKRYKNLTALLKVWPAQTRLKIVGKSESDTLRNELTAVIKERGLDVDWDDRFIPDQELNDLLQRTQYVILTHSEDSMIVSGAFYHAVTFGCNLLMADNAFARNMVKRHSFCHMLNSDEQMETQLRNALLSAESAGELVDQAYNHYSDDLVNKGFEQALVGKGVYE